MREFIVRWDEAAVLWMCGRRRGVVDRVMKTLTRIGDGYVWIAAGVAMVLLSPRGGSLLRVLPVSFAIERTIYFLTKRSVSRVRPFHSMPGVSRLVVPPDEFSFPSGHTAAAFVMTTVAAMYCPLLLPLFLPLALGIGISRVYLGVHFPTDVFAGALLGIGSAVTANFIT